jgi:hypothetical protein
MALCSTFAKKSNPSRTAKARRKYLHKNINTSDLGSIWQQKKPHSTFDERYAVNIANRFDIFKKDTEEPRNQRSSKGNKDSEEHIQNLPLQNFQIRSEAYKNPNHHFFMVDHLDNQIHIFNLTRYAFSEKHKARVPEPFQPISPQVERLSSKSASPSSYIPPHRRNHIPHHSVNPSPTPKSSLRYAKDERVKISCKAIKSSWDKCIKKGIFAIWNGPQDDFPLLLDWLEES